MIHRSNLHVVCKSTKITKTEQRRLMLYPKVQIYFYAHSGLTIVIDVLNTNKKKTEIEKNIFLI